jgi:amidophosphoribosyltransferase
MRQAAGDPGIGGGHFCDACFSGYYPVKFPRLKADSQLGLF